MTAEPTGTAGTVPQRVVVVGTSVAGVRAAQSLRADGFDGELTLIGAETGAPYDKPPLSKEVLSGEQGPGDIGLLRDGDDFSLRLGSAATALDPGRKVVTLADGDQVPYDALVIATGVRARTPPGTGPELALPVRDLADATALRDRLGTGEPVVIIGGGFIGAEVAAAAAAAGCPVTIVEALPAPFARVLGPEVGALLTELHAAHGVMVLADTPVAGLEPLREDALIRLSDGRTLQARTVVAGVGCVPNTEWLTDSGLPVDDGVRTDERCAVRGAADVYAIGDVARWHDRRSGGYRRVEHWTNAVEQASLVAHQILGPGQSRYHASVPYFWSDQYGAKIQMVGRASPGDRVEVARYATSAGDRVAAVYARGGRLTAAVTFGWPRASVAARQAWQRGASADDLRTTLADRSSGVVPLDLTRPGTAAEIIIAAAAAPRTDTTARTAATAPAGTSASTATTPARTASTARKGS
jgi:phthalate 3,4-dioxygenase ferredoxin reductase subunit